MYSYYSLYIDHIAVELFVLGEVPSLTLHLPAKWDKSSDRPHFHDNGSEDSRKNPGRVANKLHREFSEKIGTNTLQQIEIATSLGAKLEDHNGFTKRNAKVATSDYLLAFTWGEGEEPKKGGGTHNTWKMCKGKKLHIPLSSLAQPLTSPAVKRTKPIAEMLCDSDSSLTAPKRPKLSS